MNPMKITLIVCFLVCVCILSSPAQINKQSEEWKPLIVSSVAAPNGWRFEWTDSAIAARGQFLRPLTSKDFGRDANRLWVDAKPETLQGVPCWRGGVFVIPGTSDSILKAHGFKNPIRRSGSVMHDYYEAFWPKDLDLNQLPLAIRQVKYYTRSLRIPPVDSVQTFSENGNLFLHDIHVYTIPKLPVQFLRAYGLSYLYFSRNRDGIDEYDCSLPVEIDPLSLPPEFIYLQKEILPPPPIPKNE
jgi:hypothetical protein